MPYKYSLLGVFFALLLSCQEKTPIPPPVEQSDYFVTKTVAANIAENIELTHTTTGLENTKNLTIKNILPVTDNGKKTVFYIINYEPTGFVILAADKRSIPVLAYSKTSPFKTDISNYPPGLVSWLANRRDHISYIRKKHLAQSLSLEENWDKLIAGKTPLIPHPTPAPSKVPPDNGCDEFFIEKGPLLNTIWGQKCGFNDNMPVKTCTTACGTNNRAFAGCVPIAIAQVMRYYEYPNTFNWSQMPSNVATNATASFIRTIWDNIPASEKNIQCQATGVDHDYNIANFMKVDFNYTSANNADYNSTTVRQQIDLGQPVILSGGNDTGWWIFHQYSNGHMWVCDGYRHSKVCMGNNYAVTLLYLHMNWGWSGDLNAWYAYNNFDPGNYNFNYDIEMVYNIHP